ncbi:MAG: tetratricopeptide repeat protein [Variovorax sp.]|nr:MAG: tetratricopeptide repeat protein [Variovorax sp.]
MGEQAPPIKPPLYVVRITGVASSGAVVNGTGFVVSPQGHVATCRHVVCPTADGKPVTQLRVKLPYPAEQAYSYQVTSTSAEDLAVLESTVPLDFPVPEPLLHENWAQDTRIGDVVSVWGYSAAEHYTQAQHFECAVSGLSGPHGRIGLSGNVNFGDSGGPVLDRNRRVIGIAQAKDAKREGQAMAIPVSLLRTLLREIGVDASQAVDLDDDVVFQAPLPPDYTLVGRDPLLKDLKLELAGGRHVALCFKPGVGKSALATALANDREMRARFDSGVLWASLNLKPNVLSELKKWGAAIGLPPEKMEELDNLPPDPNATPEEAAQQAIAHWARALSRQIGQRRMLLVIDDAWDLEPARALLLPAPNCGHLITTREQGKVAGMLGESFEVHVVQELSEDDGVEFLRQLAPNAVDMFPDEARKLFHAVGGLPQGLLLLGMHLRQASWANQRRRIGDAYRDIQERFKERTEPLQRAIKISYDALPDDETRRALQALSIFRPKPGKFTEDAALAVLDGPPGLIYRLHDAGLIETASGDDPHDLPYTMHRTIAEFARGELSREEAQALHGRAKEFFSAWLKAYEEIEHEPGKYGHEYRYENPQWQDAMDDFLYHLARSGDPASAIVDFGSIYLKAFWWWGCYADFPFCKRLLQQASTKRLSDEARRAFDLLVAFDAAYPKETERKPGDDWEGVRKALSELRALGGLDGELSPSEDEVTRYTRALTDIFLAEAYRFGRKDHAEAERLYKDALALFAESDWSRPWAMYHLGDLYLETRRHDEARRLCTDCLALAEAVELPLKDRDNEVIANAYRLRAEVAEHLGSHDEVLDSLQRTVLHAYAFQAIPEPPDTYTVPFYRQVTARAAGLLQALYRAEPARALAYCDAMRTYWTSYRELANVDVRPASQPELEAMLAAPQTDGLCAYLFPAAPPPDAMHLRGSRYFNEAITILNEKMGGA